MLLILRTGHYVKFIADVTELSPNEKITDSIEGYFLMKILYISKMACNIMRVRRS
ncbi:MAG: hypothetical protein P857_1072 [Candidatus Xenolissoclinum pacificiensis L6]|uniref:Uncharacterized protein n=1 Tax=Candidatus Xenolissoclinum pacificiensis L6 TaxID=1401685 RepID=W2V2K5_9RICK|nr:MAG: hypothetical protein P857_1072 [Candidatus Xenolissoclinum pacificiensis L6]